MSSFFFIGGQTVIIVIIVSDQTSKMQNGEESMGTSFQNQQGNTHTRNHSVRMVSFARVDLEFRLFLEQSGELLSQHDVALHFEFALGEKLPIEEKVVIDREEKSRVSTTYSGCTRFAGR